MTQAIALAGRIRPMRHRFFVVLGSVLAYATLVTGQAPPPNSAGSDTAAIRQRLDALRKTAGSEWSETFDFFCAMNPNRANRADDPEIEPARVFDNLAAVAEAAVRLPFLRGTWWHFWLTVIGGSFVVAFVGGYLIATREASTMAKLRQPPAKPAPVPENAT